MGCDAKVVLNFHLHRESQPSLFTSRIINKVYKYIELMHIFFSMFLSVKISAHSVSSLEGGCHVGEFNDLLHVLFP